MKRSDSRNVPRTQQELRNLGSSSLLGKREQNEELISGVRKREMATALEQRGANKYQ